MVVQTREETPKEAHLALYELGLREILAREGFPRGTQVIRSG